MPKIDQWSVCVADCIGGRTGMVAVTAIVWQLALLCNLFQKLSFSSSFLPPSFPPWLSHPRIEAGSVITTDHIQISISLMTTISFK